jgi:protein-S-isoprenylcysteine O-methyltransferase Ste14
MTKNTIERQSYSAQSWILVSLQLICLGYIFTSASWRAVRIDLQIWELSGVFLALTGVLGLNWHSFSIFPEPKTKGRLITSGIFAYIRHPIYAGILLVCSSIIWQYWSIERVLTFLSLTSIFIIKIQKEEKFLITKYPEYSDYQKITNRLIPFLW